MFTYTLPPELIAHKAAEPRESARLLQWGNNGTGTLHTYADLPSILEKGSLLVFNESKVIPARLFGTRRARVEGQGDVACEILLHRPLQPDLTRWQALAKPGRRLRDGDQITLEGGATATIEGWEGGFVNLALNLKPADVEPYLNAHGHTPLPPYINAQDTAETRNRYQTVFAKTPGSVAAPTASLHFSQALLEALDKAGIHTAKVTLHVGAGTFLNPTPEQIAAGKLHAEWCHLPPETAQAINEAKAEGRPVIPVGTTSLRTLEGAALHHLHPKPYTLNPYTGETDIFIQPGFQFRVADRLLTNFHLPGSSLLMLVAAFIGETQLAALYEKAMAERMRFYSFGDGCLLTRAN
jgi:S-adenosylmethionine:tRNA ribosyltransferase-isomerase